MRNSEFRVRNLFCGHGSCMVKCFLFIATMLFVVVASSASEGCRVTAVRWSGVHEPYDESQMASVVGEPCENWTLARDQLLRYYENHGFLAAKLSGNVDSAGVLTLQMQRGSAWVWADPENLDSSGSRPEVFRRQTGIAAGDLVSM